MTKSLEKFKAFFKVVYTSCSSLIVLSNSIETANAYQPYGWGSSSGDLKAFVLKLLGLAHTFLSAFCPVIGTYLVISGIYRIAKTDQTPYAKGGGTRIVVGALLIGYKTTMGVILTTLKKAGLNLHFF